MNDATKRSILRWIHIIFGIPILGYIYGEPSEVQQYAAAVRVFFLPVIVLSGFWNGKAMSFDALFRKDRPNTTLGLAPVILEQLSKALELLRQTTPITVLLGEQNVTFALPHADRVYVLEHSRIVWEGGPDRFAQEMGAGYL